MSEKNFSRREAIWIGALGIVQLGVLMTASAGLLDLSKEPEKPRIQLANLNNTPDRIINSAQPEINIAVASVISPMENVNLYGDMLNLLGDRIQKRVHMVQRLNYSETNKLIESGEVQVAFICSGALLEVDRQAQADRILVTPEIAGSTTYRSYIVVPATSNVGKLDDLRGRSFAYMDPLSFSGRIAPQYMIKKLGYKPENFFKKSIYTYSHDNSINAVADGIVDGAAVDSLIYHLTLSRKPELMKKIKVIDQSEEVGNPPVVISSKADPQLRAQIKNALLTMHMDEEGRKALTLLQFDRFVHPDLKLYDKVWVMAREVGLF